MCGCNRAKDGRGCSGAIIGLIDRDFYSDDVLNAVTDGVTVLPLHEIESFSATKRLSQAYQNRLARIRIRSGMHSLTGYVMSFAVRR